MTKRLKFLVAFRPGLISPTLAAQMASSFQRVCGGRLLLNVVVGGDEVEQRRFGDFLSKDDRYARADDFLSIVRGAWESESFDFSGEHISVADAQVPDAPLWPRIYFGGSSPAALEVAARHADVVPDLGRAAGAGGREARPRALAGGRRGPRARLRHPPARDRARDLRGGVGGGRQAARRARSGGRSSGRRRTCASPPRRASAGCSRSTSGSKDGLEIYPNLWAGVGLVRGGAGTALVGSYEEVADRIAEYHDHGLEEFILSGYPHLEEAYHVGEGVRPILRERGLLKEDAPLVTA